MKASLSARLGYSRRENGDARYDDLARQASALIETFQSRRYKPATQNGKPVRVLYMFKVTLVLPQ